MYKNVNRTRKACKAIVFVERKQVGSCFCSINLFLSGFLMTINYYLLLGHQTSKNIVIEVRMKMFKAYLSFKETDLRVKKE